jgi:chromosome segregation protein
MLLKRLELQGYKTFATRTEFVFESGITAIVGPNGSGKSNIADAIRWVLGEQSYGLLRGKRTEDMIFSGTQKRPRAGMAQATILLDNDDGHLPVAFSEVAISRRAYRSGENEYLLNGSRVRLRDINELLAASGLGQRTYNVIGQGLVDAALSLRADERRKLFEEAAGIALYKERREDALSKLEATQRNLERVEDILSEIKPRMRRLERQAARSREYEQVSKDLESLLYVWHGYHWEMAKQTFREARADAIKQTETLTAAREAQSDLERQLTALRHEASQLRLRLGDLHHQNSQLHRQAERLQRSLAVRAERFRLLGQQQEELETEIHSLQVQRRPLAEQFELTGRELDRVDSLWQDKRQAVGQAREALETHRQEASDLRHQHDQVLGDLVRTESLIAGAEDRALRLAQSRRELDAEREAIQDALEGEKIQHQTTRQELDALRQQLESDSARLAELEQGQAALSRRRQGAQDQLMQAQQEEQQARAALAELAARQRAIADLRERGAGHEAAVQQLMTASDRPEGIVGPVAQLLHVPARFESAISAVLATELSTVVVEDTAAQRRVTTFADGARYAGRLSLLPLRELRPSRSLSPQLEGLAAQPGVLGLAADVVDCHPLHRPVVDLFLGQVLLVRSREQAQQLASALPPGGRAVALDGFSAHQDGRVTIPGREPRGNLLAQERAWRTLPAEHDAASADLEAAEARTAAVQARLLQIDAELERHSALVTRTRQEQQATNLEREAAALRWERSSQSIAWHSEQLQGVESQASTVQDEITALHESRQSLQEKLEALRLHSREISAQMADIPLDQLVGDLSTQERALAEVEGMRRNQQMVVRTLGTSLQQLEDQLAARQQRVQEIAHERDQLLIETEKERQEERSLTQRIAEVGQYIAPADARLAEIETKLEEMLADEDRLRRQVRSAEQIANHGSLALDRSKNELEHLRLRIRDELGLVSLPLDEDMEGQTPLPLGEIVGHLPVVTELPPDLEGSILRRKQQLRRMGAINPDAPAEYAELQQRHAFLTSQTSDLRQADAKLRQVVAELDGVMEKDFRQTFNAVAAEFSQTFTRLFGGGSARLILTDPEDPIQSGVEIVARPPDRRQQGLALLSGGERSLTAAALMFALIKTSPTPFCVLDEVDAMLDEANVGRFREILSELSQKTQFIVITHNRGTIQSADTIYGISMGTDGASQVISLRLDGEQLASPEEE